MKSILYFSLAAILAVCAISARAGGSCCLSGKAKDKTAENCEDTFSKMNLTAEQKEKIAGLKAEAVKAEWSKEASEKFQNGVKEILTPEQRAEWKTACEMKSPKKD